MPRPDWTEIHHMQKTLRRLRNRGAFGIHIRPADRALRVAENQFLFALNVALIQGRVNVVGSSHLKFKNKMQAHHNNYNRPQSHHSFKTTPLDLT